MAKPTYGVSTKKVFKNIDSYTVSQRPVNNQIIEGLKKKKYDLVYKNMINVLELYTLDKYNSVKVLKDIFVKETNAKKVLMSGSGPTVFGIYDTFEEAKIACASMRELKYKA